MAIGMATEKITITLDQEHLAQVRAIVASGKASNVSAFVKHAVANALRDEEGWAAMLAEALERTGGPLTSRERAQADRVLRPARATARRQRRAA
jgi:Arc/MetJ-type ribon-helix-helix transcriptional regulator